MLYTDCHMHLQDTRVAELRPRIIQQAKDAGIHRCLINATEAADWQAVIDMASKLREIQLIAFVGLHPWFVDAASENWHQQLEKIVAESDCQIGEIGLDKTDHSGDWDAQLAAFKWQLQLANKYNRCVAIHCVGAYGDMLEILKNAPQPAAVQLHSFGGSAEIASQLASTGTYFSFAANIANPARKRARQALAAIAADRLLCESDCPDMPWPTSGSCTLTGSDGKTISQPADIPETIKIMAELRGENAQQLASQIEQNAQRFLDSAVKTR